MSQRETFNTQYNLKHKVSRLLAGSLSLPLCTQCAQPRSCETFGWSHEGVSLFLCDSYWTPPWVYWSLSLVSFVGLFCRVRRSIFGHPCGFVVARNERSRAIVMENAQSIMFAAKHTHAHTHTLHTHAHTHTHSLTHTHTITHTHTHTHARMHTHMHTQTHTHTRVRVRARAHTHRLPQLNTQACTQANISQQLNTQLRVDRAF